MTPVTPLFALQVLWFVSFALPIEFLTFLAREEADAAEEEAFEEGLRRIEAAAAEAAKAVEVAAAAESGRDASIVDSARSSDRAPPGLPPAPSTVAVAAGTPHNGEGLGAGILSAVSALFQVGSNGSATIVAGGDRDPAAAHAVVAAPTTTPASAAGDDVPHSDAHTPSGGGLGAALHSITAFTSPVASAWKAMAESVSIGVAVPTGAVQPSQPTSAGVHAEGGVVDTSHLNIAILAEDDIATPPMQTEGGGVEAVAGIAAAGGQETARSATPAPARARRVSLSMTEALVAAANAAVAAFGVGGGGSGGGGGGAVGEPGVAEVV